MKSDGFYSFMNPTNKDINSLSNLEINESFAIAEYNALRAEILARSRTRHEFIKLTITGAGVFIALFTKSKDFLNVLLIYPILVMFFALNWHRNLIANLSISQYIQSKIESNAYKGWETFLLEKKSEYNKEFIFLGSLSFGGLFILTQLLCLLIAITELRTGSIFIPNSQVILLALSIISVKITSLLILSATQKKLEQNFPPIINK